MSAGGVATGAVVGGGERLVLTLLFSALLHGVVLLGVGFGTGQPAAAPPMLDIILVATGTNQAPDQADFLAQANQEGGGDLDEAVRPTALASASSSERAKPPVVTASPMRSIAWRTSVFFRTRNSTPTSRKRERSSFA